MREIIKQIDNVKYRVSQLVGQPVSFKVNHGRNRTQTFLGRVETVYPDIFTISSTEVGVAKLQTFSYNDILTHNICFLARG